MISVLSNHKFHDEDIMTEADVNPILYSSSIRVMILAGLGRLSDKKLVTKTRTYIFPSDTEGVAATL